MMKQNYLLLAVLTVALILPGCQAARSEGEAPAFSPSAKIPERFNSNFSGYELKGNVVGVSDGDTITALDENKRDYRVRLLGIDAPEKNQAYGVRAKENLSRLVFGKAIIVRFEKKDRYGRILGIVYVNESDINLEQVKAGLAWHYKKYSSDQPADESRLYAEAEESARLNKLGLWQDANPTPPWNFRRGQAEEEDAPPAQTDKINSAPKTNAGRTERMPAAAGVIIGNRKSGIYHLPHCPNYRDVSEQNKIEFPSEAEAVKAGMRRARNCP